MKKNPFVSFDKYLLRTPLLPLSFFKELTHEKQVDTQALKRVYSDNPVVREAIFLASPSLYERLKKWCSNEIEDQKEVEKLTYSFLKYLSRMCSRCTPFGLFAGTGVGSFSEMTKIELEKYEKFRRHTRLDMNYLIACSQKLIKDPVIRQQLRFYPNSSLYRIGNEWRYIEYHYKNNKRVHQMVSLEDADYLRTIISVSENGAYLSDLVGLLEEGEVSGEEASEFVDELVNSQLLISELEPSVSGPEFSNQLMACLRKMKHVDRLLQALDQAEENIKSLDKKLGNDAQDYLRVKGLLKSLGASFELKHMFQTDMILTHKNNTLSSTIKDKVLKAMALMVKTSTPREETLLMQFGKALYARFETREVPLARALDVEAGIGYKQTQGSGDVNYLIDDIIVPATQKSNFSTINLTAAQQILHKKLIQYTKLGKSVIQLSDKDFEQFGLNWDDLSDTLPTMLQFIHEENREKVVLSGFGGSSAANLLARFCHGDDEIHKHTIDIIEKESAISKDKILAEIVHLPEARVGNILMRPALRRYEIPYLAKSVLPTENQIPIDDLVVSAKPNGMVCLRSVSKNKEVIPCLSNAHNYSSQSLPIYHFLADFQTQGKRMPGFGWGALGQMYKYLPRIEYGDIILSKAQWIISKDEIKNMVEAKSEDGQLTEALGLWKKTYQIPQYVLLVDGDNELLINTCNLTSVRMLLNEVKKRMEFRLSEFLYQENTVVKQGSNQYTNQVVMSFFNAEKLKIKNS